MRRDIRYEAHLSDQDGPGREDRPGTPRAAGRGPRGGEFTDEVRYQQLQILYVYIYIYIHTHLIYLTKPMYYTWAAQ